MTEIKKNTYYRFDDRTYISVPEAKDDQVLKEQIKNAGAKWDGARSCWYYISGATRDENYLDQFKKVNPETLDKIVTRYLEISKEQRTEAVVEALKSCNATWDGDNCAWRVQETNDHLPDALSGFKIKTSDELVKRVYLDVPVKDRGDKAKKSGLRWDRSHQSYYTTIPRKENPAESYYGFKVFTPDTQQETFYFNNLTRAKTDEEFRTQLKNAGAKWSPSVQAWTITVSKEHPLPEFLKSYEPTEREKLQKYELHKFSIPEAQTNVTNSKALRDELYAAGAKFNKDDKTYEIWIMKGGELPPVFANRQEIQRNPQQDNQKKQIEPQTRSIHR